MERKKDLISVVLPFCNSQTTLAACIESILSQSYSRFELLVADYGSTDGSGEIIDSFQDKRIHRIECPADYVKALNTLMEQAKGKYVVRIDAEYTMSRGRLHWQYRFMESHLEVALSGGFVKQDGFRSTIRKVPFKVTEMALLENRNIFPTTTILRKEVWEQYGLRYEEQYHKSADYALYDEMLYRELILLNADTVLAECKEWIEESTERQEAVEDGIRLEIAKRIKLREDEVKQDFQILPPSRNRLSVLMSFLNEREEVGRTVRSIRDTVGNQVDIIVINDHSDDGYDYEADLKGLNVHYYYNKYRIGAAAGKEKAVQICSTPYFILLDAHMRFYDTNWAKRIVEELDKNPHQLLCCQTRMLRKLKNGKVKDRGEMGVFGAYVNFCGDGYIPAIQWNSGNIATCLDEGQIPAVLGASYCSSKKYWNKLKGLQGLIHYGCEEAYISIKAWLEGGGCRLINDIVIVHLYREKAPYILVGLPNLYNYLVIIKTLLPISEQGPAIATFVQRNPKLYKRLISLVTVHKKQLKALSKYYQKTFLAHDFPFIRRINRIVPYEELLVTDAEKDRLNAIVKRIMLHTSDSYSDGLFKGKAGEMLALAYFARKNKDEEADRCASRILARLLHALKNPELPMTFANGLYGIGWSLVYLLRNKFIEGTCLEKELTYIDHRIMERDISRIEDISIETGLGGILAYVVARLGMAHKLSDCNFDKIYLTRLRKVCQKIVNNTPHNHRTLSLALQFLYCLENRSWDLLPPQVEDVIDLPLFLPKDPQFQKRGLVGQAGFVIFLTDRLQTRNNYRQFKS